MLVYYFMQHLLTRIPKFTEANRRAHDDFDNERLALLWGQRAIRGRDSSYAQLRNSNSDPQQGFINSARKLIELFSESGNRDYILGAVKYNLHEFKKVGLDANLTVNELDLYRAHCALRELSASSTSQGPNEFRELQPEMVTREQYKYLLVSRSVHQSMYHFFQALFWLDKWICSAGDKANTIKPVFDELCQKVFRPIIELYDAASRQELAEQISKSSSPDRDEEPLTTDTLLQFFEKLTIQK